MKINLLKFLGDSFPAALLFTILCILLAILLQLCCMQKDNAEHLDSIRFDILSGEKDLKGIS